MNLLEKNFDRLLRSIAWKMTNIKDIEKNKNNFSKKEKEININQENDLTIDVIHTYDNENIETNINIDDYIIKRIDDIQLFILNQTNQIFSKEEILLILINTININELQYYCGNDDWNNIELNINNMIKQFLIDKSNKQILELMYKTKSIYNTTDTIDFTNKEIYEEDMILKLTKNKSI